MTHMGHFHCNDDHCKQLLIHKQEIKLTVFQKKRPKQTAEACNVELVSLLRQRQSHLQCRYNEVCLYITYWSTLLLQSLSSLALKNQSLLNHNTIDVGMSPETQS